MNKGNESRPKDDSAHRNARELNCVDGFETAVKLAKVCLFLRSTNASPLCLHPMISKANVDDLIKPLLEKTASKDSSSGTSAIQNPTTYSTVYLRIQPYTTPSPFHPSAGESSTFTSPGHQQLQFLLHLRDPSHSLESSIITQSLPASWMDLWDEHEWVEDQLAEILRLGVEVLGQEYVVARMHWAVPTEAKEDEDDEAFEKVDAHEKTA